MDTGKLAGGKKYAWKGEGSRSVRAFYAKAFGLCPEDSGNLSRILSILDKVIIVRKIILAAR